MALQSFINIPTLRLILCIFFINSLAAPARAQTTQPISSGHPDFLHGKQSEQIGGYIPPKIAQQNTKLSDKDIASAYIYLLGRLVFLQHEQADQQQAIRWNQFTHYEPGQMSPITPDPNIAYSEACIALDENTPIILEIPPITNRYYTLQILNGWGETLLNINERRFPQKPFGKYALCLIGSNPKIPSDAQRVDIPSTTAQIIGRIEIKNDPQEAALLQNQITLNPTGTPQTPPEIKIAPFTPNRLPEAEIFNNATAILDSQPDINPGMEPIRQKVRATEALLKSDPSAQARITKIINKNVIPHIKEAIQNSNAKKHGWARPSKIGNYGVDYVSRAVNDLVNFGANNNSECVFFTTNVDKTGQPLTGTSTYTMTFSRDQLPQYHAKSFWSIYTQNPSTFKPIPNPQNRYSLSKNAPLEYNPDGSLTIVFAAILPKGYPESNWLPTLTRQNYIVTFNFYVPGQDVIDGSYMPPPLVKQR